MATRGRGRWVSVEGLEEAKDAFASMPEAFRDEVIPTLAAGGEIIEAEAKRRVPVAEGDLERSITTETSEQGLNVSVGSPLFYAKFPEFGTSTAPARPWLYPAFRLGAKYVRKQMRVWAAAATKKVRFRTKRKKR